MKYYNMFFLRRRSLILKAVLILTALWFMVALLTTNSGGRNTIVAPPVEYDDVEAKPLRAAKVPIVKKNSETNGINLSDGKIFSLNIMDDNFNNTVILIGGVMCFMK